MYQCDKTVNNALGIMFSTTQQSDERGGLVKIKGGSRRNEEAMEGPTFRH
jgi:hypothetical protein